MFDAVQAGKRTIVFDIDGTLADLMHRLHFIKGKKRDYDAFYDAMKDDAPIKPMISMYQMIARNKIKHSTDVVIATGRPDSHEYETMNWLVRHGIDSFDKLYMRKAGDHRRDDIVKFEMLEQMRADGREPFFVFDARQRVVDMWRSNGIMVGQVAQWEE